MNGKAADTNVVLYLAGSDERKRAKAREIVAPGTVLSVQVLNEVANVFIRKWRRTWSDTEEFLDLVRGLAVVRALDENTHDMGLAIARRYNIAIYDSLIIASALLSDCDTLYSEDMHPGLVISSKLTIVNPFA